MCVCERWRGRETGIVNTVVYISLQLMLVLRATEQEIQQRTKAAENGWSALTVADLQTTSEGIYQYSIITLYIVYLCNVQLYA